MSDSDFRRVEIKFFEKDDDNLSFLMKKQGLKNQSEAIRFALKAYREHAEIHLTLYKILEENKKLNKKFNTFFGDENNAN